jgi:hypothetical protein
MFAMNIGWREILASYLRSLVLSPKGPWVDGSCGIISRRRYSADRTHASIVDQMAAGVAGRGLCPKEIFFRAHGGADPAI